MVANLGAVRRFTAGEYYRMLEAGILHEDDRVELIDGIIVEMSPIGPRQALCVDRLARALASALGPDRVWLRVQGPISLPNQSEPQPDLLLARPPGNRYAARHPGAGDLLLVVEVADSSIMFDRQTKMPLYGAAGIPEVWLVDLTWNLVEVHTTPQTHGYANVRVVRMDGELSPQAFPDLSLKVSEILA